MNKEEAIKRLESIKETYETFAHELDDIHLDIDAISMAIEALEQEPEWIPVSETLPEENICEAPGPAWKRKVLITGYYSFSSKEDAFIGAAFARDVKNNSIQDVNVIAWMPYPEIYKESEE